MTSISDYSSDRFLIQLSFSLSLHSSKSKKWETCINKTSTSLKNRKIESCSLEDLMKNCSAFSGFIDYNKLKTENYLGVTPENIAQFNNILVKSIQEKRIERRENMVGGAFDYGAHILFLKDSKYSDKKILETTKLILTGHSARCYMYTQKKFREKITKYVLPEIEIKIKKNQNWEFIIIPIITLWDSYKNFNKEKKSQFITINLIFLPKIKSNGPILSEHVYELINEMSQPKLYDIQVEILKEQIFCEIIFNKGESSLKEIYDVLIKGISKFLGGEDESSDYPQNLMMSVICDYMLEGKICSIPNYSTCRDYSSKEIEMFKLLSCYLYHFFWNDSDPINCCKLHELDYKNELSNDQITHLPFNVSTFFTEKRHLTVLVLLAEDAFPNYSYIWALGSDILDNEIMSIQIYLISWYNLKLREIDSDEDLYKLKAIRRNKIFDFEPFYNMETDDLDLKIRIDKMQSKLGIQQKYCALNTCIDNLSSLINEKENENLQITMTELTWAATILGLINIISVWVVTFNIRLYLFITGLLLIAFGFIYIQRKRIKHLLK